MTIEKAKMYRTARSKVETHQFSAGEFVGIESAWQSAAGVIWFTINSSERGGLRICECLAAAQLDDFCL